MLNAPLGVGKPVRIQGAFVTDEEREAVVDFVKQNGGANYNEEIQAAIEKAAEDKPANGAQAHAESVDEAPESSYDELLPQAVDVIFETKQASVSMLQRRLKLGYSRVPRASSISGRSSASSGVLRAVNPARSSLRRSSGMRCRPFRHRAAGPQRAADGLFRLPG